MKLYHPLPAAFLDLLANEENIILLETSKPDDASCTSYLFVEPEVLPQVYDTPGMSNLLSEINELSQHCYVAGFVSYEAGYFLEEKLDHLREPCEFPLAWFGAFKTAISFNHLTGRVTVPEGFAYPSSANELNQPFGIENMQLNTESAIYEDKIARIKDYIRRGDTYQVNLTTKYTFRFTGDPICFYRNLTGRQRVGYNAFIKFGGISILSCSPELFFEVSPPGLITTRPMKGTFGRGRTTAEDQKHAETLRSDPKNRSENVMIVDLLRNDLGRICEIGSVTTQSLFDVEKYDTIFQLTSTIQGQLRQGVTFGDIMRSLFPCGSVTGAPKIRTMEIIRELENEDRGVYCGAIGFLSPSGEARFSVPIRTITLKGGHGEMGVGGGIVYDSVPAQEFEECLLKATFLVETVPDFSLIESILFENGRLHRLQAHFERLRDSAFYFDFPFEEEEIAGRLQTELAELSAGYKYKVRLLLDRFGNLAIEVTEVPVFSSKRPLIAISDIRTHSQDRFLFHKTTNRYLYDNQFRRYSAQGFFDVIFLNEKGEVTEGAVTNIFIKVDDAYFTPPIESGLLNGVWRRSFLQDNPNAIEKTLTPDDLKEADGIYLTNSVRGMIRVFLPDATPASRDSV
jgi:para-aminobenzoate synthetase/4-amino-4-deoxychorismate lyase